MNNFYIPEGTNDPEPQENEKLSINTIDGETNLNQFKIMVDYVFS